MPVSSFLEVNPPQRHIGPPVDASDYTRAVRLMATVGPYLSNVSRGPTLGWKTNELSAQVRALAPIYGVLRSNFPNRM
jgi:hypothetical protein